MKKLLHIIAALGLVVAGAVLAGGTVAFAQTGTSPKSAAGGKAPVQGYTRVNKHTGQPEQVRPHKRRPPAPRPVEIQPYTRQGQPVAGHQRRPPGKPAEGKPKTQASLPHRGTPSGRLA